MNKNKIFVSKINLLNKVERKNYSDKLQQFEKQFTYPLGNQTFYIQHGLNTDYFTFFEKLGEPQIMILEKNNQIIGLCCAILRTINGKKIWYLCDFKISKEFRGQKLYQKLMWKYFLNSYLKCQKVFAVNMSPSNNNRLFYYTKNIFKFFNFKIKEQYLHSFDAYHLKNFSNQFWTNHLIVTNNGEKDIIILQESQKLFHIVDKQNYLNNLQKYQTVNIQNINSNDKIMLLSNKSLKLNFAEETIISLFSNTNHFFYISSLEI